MRHIVKPAILLVALLALPQLGFAQTNAQRGAAEGAEAGASALGQLGAAVGVVTGAAVGGAADIANSVVAPLDPAPTTVKRTTCVTDAAGNKRCDSIETTQ